MAIDLKSKEEQNKFIQENLSSLLESINDTFGPILIDELMSRLRFTINEFNEEITSAFTDLKTKENNRQKMYEMIREGNISIDENSQDEKELSEWEQKIE